MKPSRLLIGALIAVTAGCGDGTGPDDTSGSLSFSHSGAITGTFSATGSVLVPNQIGSNWAAAQRDDVERAIAILANVARPSNSFDSVIIFFPQLTAGTVTVAGGADVVITFGQSLSGAATWFCFLTSGSVVVASLSGDRVRGSFSGSGDCFPAEGSPVAFSVTNGSFDVPLVDITAL